MIAQLLEGADRGDVVGEQPDVDADDPAVGSSHELIKAGMDLCLVDHYASSSLERASSGSSASSTPPASKQLSAPV
ncbi:hypothetical protein SDC9_138261 [bioreactor metagenome]|uniref:Uncharacterized protein n=1 Tax=bioreactor metagenome TaxID=1076179 RepID=A0A645DPF7_9ZZZZ